MRARRTLKRGRFRPRNSTQRRSSRSRTHAHNRSRFLKRKMHIRERAIRAQTLRLRCRALPPVRLTVNPENNVVTAACDEQRALKHTGNRDASTCFVMRCERRMGRRSSRRVGQNYGLTSAMKTNTYSPANRAASLYLARTSRNAVHFANSHQPIGATAPVNCTCSSASASMFFHTPSSSDNRSTVYTNTLVCTCQLDSLNNNSSSTPTRSAYPHYSSPGISSSLKINPKCDPENRVHFDLESSKDSSVVATEIRSASVRTRPMYNRLYSAPPTGTPSPTPSSSPRLPARSLTLSRSSTEKV